MLYPAKFLLKLFPILRLVSLEVFAVFSALIPSRTLAVGADVSNFPGLEWVISPTLTIGIFITSPNRVYCPGVMATTPDISAVAAHSVYSTG